ncbi:MAG: tetratricopeptide repeat protein, partial [Bacteroidia bacterium]
MKSLYKTSLLFFLLFYSGLFNAQKADSLKQVLKKQSTDTGSVFILVSLGHYYTTHDQLDTALYYLEIARTKAEKNTNRKFLGLANYYIGLAYSNAGQDARSRVYFNKAIADYLKSNRLSRLGDVYNSIGVTYYYEGKYDSAIVYYSTAADYALKNKDSLLVGRCYNNLGTMYDIKGERVKSVEYYIKAIKMYENNKRKDLCIGPYQNMALVYFNNKQYPQAVKCLETAKKIAIDIKENKTLCRIYNTIASVMDEQGKALEANRIFKKALYLAKEEKDEALCAICLNNLAENSLYLDKNEEAENLLLECIELKKKLNNPVSLGISEIALGQAYVRTKKYAAAIASFNSGMKKVKDAGYLEYQKTAFEGLAASYGRSGSYKEAYSNLDSFVKINNTLLKESNNKVIGELETKYQSDK